MDHTFLQDFNEAIANLCENHDCLLLLNLSLFLHVASEVSSVAKLLNNVIIVCAFHDVEKPNDVWTFECFKYVDFCK